MDTMVVLSVADGPRLAGELRRVFCRHRWVSLLGPALDEVDVHEIVRAISVDVAVVDLDRGDGRAIGLIETLTATMSLSVLASSGRSDPETAALVLAAGGAGLLPRDRDRGRLTQAFRMARAGEIVLEDRHLFSVVEHLRWTRSRGVNGDIEALTPREREILVLLCDGRTLGEMSAILGISGSTVQAHIRGVFTKLGVHSQMEAVRAAWRCGIGVPASA